MTEDSTYSYCKAVATMPADSPHHHYHDQLYGFPITDDNELFGRLILEINQAGLNWTTILKKAANFRKAYSNFNVNAIANYGEEDRKRLLNDAGIIRNKLKVNAAIHNAQVILQLQKEFGSFYDWLRAHHPQDKAAWTKLFKKTFKFTGGEIVGELLMSTGFLPGAHETSCPIYSIIADLNPPWMEE